MLNINLQADNAEDLIADMQEVAKKIDEGYTHGITWNGNCWSVEEV